jgi:transcriptional regulator GlxA family with amidase domain
MLQTQLLLFEGCDLLDVGGPYEVLLTANRVAAEVGESTPFEVVTVSVTGDEVVAYGGMGLRPHRAATPDGDAFIVPGAIDLDPVLGDDDVMDAIRRCGGSAGLLASVCTGSILLAAAGLLEGTAATTHHQDVGLLGDRIGRDHVRTEVRWVDAGRVVTAGGLSSGIAMTLHLVARQTSTSFATTVAERIEYDWDPDGGVTVAP